MAVLLSGGNPQIPKGDGPGPVRDYIEAMPGWKRDIGRRIQFPLGTSLDPVPPKPSKHEGMRYADILETDTLDEAVIRSWVEQSARLPGARVF